MWFHMCHGQNLGSLWARLPRSGVGRWPHDHRVCDPFAFGLPLPLSSDLCFDVDWPCGLFWGSVVRPCGRFSSFGETSVPWHGADVRSLSTWHHKQLPIEDLQFSKQLSSSAKIAVSVCHCLFTRQGTTARCGLSTAFLSVTFPWHTASTL